MIRRDGSRAPPSAVDLLPSRSGVALDVARVVCMCCRETRSPLRCRYNRLRGILKISCALVASQAPVVGVLNVGCQLPFPARPLSTSTGADSIMPIPVAILTGRIGADARPPRGRVPIPRARTGIRDVNPRGGIAPEPRRVEVGSRKGSGSPL